VRQVYLRRAKRFPQRCRVVKASAALQKVQESLAKILDEYMLSN
jgi:thymidylate kinase